MTRLLFTRHLKQRFQHAKRLASTDPYVNKVRLLEYYNQSDHALEAEYPQSQSILMVDKEPLVNGFKLVRFETEDLKSRLNTYGLEIGLLNSCLLDIVDPCDDHKDYRPLFGTSIRTMEPPAESKIDAKELRNELGQSLGGKFQNLRMAMLTLNDEEDQNLLARFQALIRWTHIYRRCPTCTATLRPRLSKFSAKCIRCQRDFYPINNPVAICLIRDKTNEKCLLIKHLGSLSSVFTLVSGFSSTGESIQQTVQREVAEEVGILCSEIKCLNFSQSWPIPYSSLMLAFTAIADPSHELNISPGELDAAGWFTRNEVQKALERVQKDPTLKGAFKLSHDVKLGNQLSIEQNSLKYVPPQGAIAHKIIKGWLDRKF